MSEFDSFSSRFERSLSDLNDMRMALGVMEYGPVDNPRFGQFERLRLDTRKMIACEFGEKTTGINVLEAAYFQMRCSGMSEEKAVSNADKLMPLVLLGNTEKVPVLTVGVNALSKVANVIIYGKQFSGSPYISVVNPTQGETAYLQPIFPSDDINYRTTTRAYMPNTDWQVGYWDRGPNLEKLSVLDDAEEFDHLMKDGSSKILMLIGAQAVEMALPYLAGRHGSADGLGTVINFVKKSQDPDVKINEKSLNETAEDLLAKAITSNGK